MFFAQFESETGNFLNFGGFQPQQFLKNFLNFREFQPRVSYKGYLVNKLEFNVQISLIYIRRYFVALQEQESFEAMPDIELQEFQGKTITSAPVFCGDGDLFFQIKVENNLFPCNCRVIYLIKSVLGKRSPNFLENNKCISPFKMNGRPMSEMRTNGMLRQCDRKAVMDQAK